MKLALEDKLVAIKNITGKPLPEHAEACDPAEVGRAQGVRLAHCPLDQIPEFDGHQYRFKADEEILLPENAANFLVHSWRGKLALSGQSQSVLELLTNPNAMHRLTKGGTAVTRVEVPPSRDDKPQMIEQVGGRRVAELSEA